MPGWAADLPFQRLLVAPSAELPGATAQPGFCRREAGPHTRRGGATSLAASGTNLLVEEVERRTIRSPIWRTSTWVRTGSRSLSQVREAMVAIGLEPAGSATLIEGFKFASRCVAMSARRSKRFRGPALHELARVF